MSDLYFQRVLALMTRPDLLRPISDPELAAQVAANAVQPDGYEPPVVKTETRAVPGPHGDVEVRVYTPADPKGPLLVWCHGGGWVGGDLDMPEADAAAREVSARAEAVVVSVGYRLAVEGVHYPVPLDDVTAALTWSVDQAADLGADPTRVSLGGASAGANLAAGAALRVRDQGGPMPRALVLIYPLVHPVLPQLHPDLARKVAPLSPGQAFAPDVLAALVENYLGGAVAQATPYAMAGLGSAEGLPPTLVINCEYDALRASGEAYADALAAAGVVVDVSCAPGVLHGHLNQPWLPVTGDSFARMAAWISRA
jgi:acetyl esterase/lipase